jgi:alpha-L-arabinofuranosidase
MMAKGRGVTSNDVARRAGVSRATVSVVLNGTASNIRVSEETRQRVLAAADEFGYSPHPLAQALRRQRSGVAEFEGRQVAGIPHLDASATLDEGERRLYLSVVNRHRTEEIAARVRLRDAIPAGAGRLHRLWGPDALAGNTIDAPDAIAPTTAPLALDGAEFTIALPPHSYSIVEVPLPG